MQRLLERDDEAVVPEHRRAQVEGHPPCPLDGAGDELRHLLEPAPHPLGVAVLHGHADAVERDHTGRHHLDRVVVQVGGDARALLLLGAHEPLHQLAVAALEGGQPLGPLL